MGDPYWEDIMKVLRTPEERFKNLKGFPFEPRYAEIPDGEGGRLRIHYVDEGPRNAEPVLMMHGEPSWSFLYRKMIPIFIGAGYRAVAPDLVGFGRSDKPADRSDYTYNRHVGWMEAWLEQVDLKRITLVCQDWGGLIGLRLLAAHPERFARAVVANTGLPTGDFPISEAFLQWRKFSVEVPEFNVGAIINMGTLSDLPVEILEAYNAPFPDETYKEGARIFPSLVPISPDDPAAPANRLAWEVLSRFEKPLLTAFSDGDPITRGGEHIFQKMVPGAKGQLHTLIQGGGHFLQEDRGEEFAQVVIDFMSKAGKNSLPV
jgi:haloalkane dehalogenase